MGVARQYCGQLGKQDNCQVAVTLSGANEAASLPIAWRLYFPHSWAEDPEQRKKAKIPAEIPFQTKPQIALQQFAARPPGLFVKPRLQFFGDEGEGIRIPVVGNIMMRHRTMSGGSIPR
ncbi:MAG: transposase [Mesorhizobium sp.]|nr:MAG: transposase [Mesorhizobium sp.]